ncbi:MAG: C-GCAxxG-C-C family protein [Oscillospiraceae bacterium]|jgi:C_GCAxxG_C_C family probable redox protein
MTIEERAARAVELKAGCNCAQAVVLSYADKLPLEEETLKKLAAGYGGGMGCMEGTCGALVGAVMAAGMLTDGQGTGRYAREILLGFRERCGATICKDLKGVETGKVLCPCTECVRNAVLAAGAALGE